MIRRIALWVLAFSAAIFIVAAGAAYWLLSGDGIRVALESQASAWLEQPVRIASATGRVFPRLGIRLNDVRIGEPVRMTLADVELSASLRALLSGRIDEAELIISDSRIELPLPRTSSPSDNPGSDAPSAAAAGGAPIEVVSVRDIALRDIAITSRGREVVVSADAALAGSELQLERFVATSGRTRLEASGTIQLEPRVDARLEAVANRLDLDELLALAAAFQPEQGAAGQRSTGPPPRVQAHITADNASAASVEARTLVTDLKMDGQRVTLDPLTFELFGGTYAGTLQATLGDALDVRLSSKLADLDVAQLAAFGGAADTVTGRLSGLRDVQRTRCGRRIDAGGSARQRVGHHRERHGQSPQSDPHGGSVLRAAGAQCGAGRRYVRSHAGDVLAGPADHQRIRILDAIA